MQENYGIYLQNFINKSIDEKISPFEFGMPCEIVEYDGIKAKVKVLLKDYNNVEFDDVCIMQSPYLHLPIKTKDKGIAINAGYVFNELLEDKPITQNIKAIGSLALIFIPFVSESLKVEDIESTILMNKTRDSSLTLKEKNIIYKNENCELKIEDTNLTFDNKDLTLKIQGADVEIDNKSIQVKISGSDVIISGGTLKFENSAIKVEGIAGALGKAFEQVFSAMDLLSAGLTGPSSNPAAYNGGKSAIQQVIKQIVE